MGRIDSTSSAQLRSGSPSECPGFATSFVIDGADRRPADESEGRYGEHPPGEASMPPGTGHGMVIFRGNYWTTIWSLMQKVEDQHTSKGVCRICSVLHREPMSYVVQLKEPRSTRQLYET
ncbi:hypothetical protein GQ55_8G074600 [Panicum hallii var. hallii]|uniref:Uncharacterized protein n=1 Tax=Panicum hallii var. hallii TaxID=1504633 RepID=A0A2T7CLW4_9POAL|nr:hypothetical protein GQ55_8G074600 [Panicum hallii var. hallii]